MTGNQASASPVASLEEQAAAVERAAINQRGHVNRLAELVRARKRSQEEHDAQAAWTPALEAAAETMRAIAKKRLG